MVALVGIVEFIGMCIPSSRSGKRLKKTRKYDIITTPAERVEMAPLNDEDDEDEDSTVFDIKYRCAWAQQLLLGFRAWGGGMVYIRKPRKARHVFLFLAKCLTLGCAAYGGNCGDPFLKYIASQKLAEKYFLRNGYSLLLPDVNSEKSALWEEKEG